MIRKETRGMVGRVLESGLGKSGNRIWNKISSKKNSEKGFTLVELIVVLVILSIIAAVAVPRMLGLTDSAKKKQYITEAKEALASAQTMISDAYTDNLVYISTDMRDKALETSGLDGDTTEFVIWTEKSFRSADGTYETYKSYAIASALYVVNGSVFVYYDNGEWNVSDSLDIIGNKKRMGAEYARGAANYNFDSNYITVWPSHSESADKDTAINKKYADGGDEFEVEDENKKHDDNKDYDTEKPTDDKPGITVVIIAPETINGHVPLKVSGVKRIEVALKNNGFENPVVQSDLDNVRYQAENLKWLVDEQEKTSLTAVEEYLKAKYPDAESITESRKIYVRGSMPERTIPVNVNFEPYSSNTQTVMLNNNISTPVKMTYRLANEDISEMKYSNTGDAFALSQISVTAANASAAEHIKFDNNWAVKGTDGNYIMSGSNHDMTASAQIKTKVAALAKEYVENNGSTIVQAAVNSQSTVLEQSGYTFVAPACVCKKVHVRGKLNADNTDYLGKVKFGTSKALTFNETYAYDELSQKIYKAIISGDNFRKGTLVADSNGSLKNGYSIFTGHELNIDNVEYPIDDIYDKKMRVKYWTLYDSEYSYDIINNNRIDNAKKNRKQYDCTSEIISKLYADNNTDFGEVAEVDIAEITTKIENNTSGVTDIRGYFSDIINGASVDKINRIVYTDTVPAAGTVIGEKCISTTKVKRDGNNLSRKDGKYETDEGNVDPLYPAYTVAYSKEADGGKYDIFVVTEDYSKMKVEGTLQGMNSGFTAMTSNDVVERFETSGVTDMSSMFENCSSITQINLADLDTSAVTGTGMKNMFYNCSAAEEIDVTGFDTSNVRDMSFMFYNCKKVEELDLSSFNASKVTTMESMFEMVEMNYSNVANGLINDGDKTRHNKLKSINFGTTLNVSDKLQSVKCMFKNCDSLTGLDLRGFNKCSRLETINSWFSGCKSLDYIDLGNFETSSEYLGDIDRSFYYVGRFTGDVIEADQGCRVFAKAKWQYKDTIHAENPYVGTSDYTFDYFRINMYGKMYKNSNTITEGGAKYYKGGPDHLDIQAPGTIPTTTQGGGKRLYKGYFMSTNSEYYTNGTWRH